jgi:hypothetical protein
MQTVTNSHGSLQPPFRGVRLPRHVGTQFSAKVEDFGRGKDPLGQIILEMQAAGEKLDWQKFHDLSTCFGRSHLTEQSMAMLKAKFQGRGFVSCFTGLGYPQAQLQRAGIEIECFDAGPRPAAFFSGVKKGNFGKVFEPVFQGRVLFIDLLEAHCYNGCLNKALHGFAKCGGADLVLLGPGDYAGQRPFFPHVLGPDFTFYEELERCGFVLDQVQKLLAWPEIPELALRMGGNERTLFPLLQIYSRKGV